MSSRSPRVLVVGYAAFDTILPVDGPPPADAKVKVDDMVEGGGGPGATAAVALSRLGAEVLFLGVLTDDPAGRIQRAELEAAGVDLSPSPVLAGHASPRAVILVEKPTGARTIFWTRGTAPTLDPAVASPELLDGIDLFYTDGHDTAAALVLAREARRRHLPVVMDAGSVREGSRELAVFCSDVLSSGIFAPDLTGCADRVEALRALRGMGPERVAMTLGEEGVLALIDDEPVSRRAFEVPVRDTTGAGDAFHAGYARALLLGRDFVDCLDYGQAVAALKCRDWGGRRGLPVHSEVEALLAANVRRSL